MARRFGLSTALGLAILLMGARSAKADTLDCTSGICGSGSGIEFVFNSVNYASFAGALWSTTDTQPTGSGVIDSFVRIGPTGNDVIDGMNTSARPLLNDEKTDLTFTHDVQKSDIPIVKLPTLGGAGSNTDYYQFLLDINQTGSDPLLSMSQVKICTGTQSMASVVDNCAGTLRYNMDDPVAGTGDQGNNVLMNYNLNHGSGSGDLFMYIPTSYFSTNGPSNKYLYLWSQFGLPSPYENNDGYEEWAVKANLGSPTPFNVDSVPEPASLMLLGTGLVMGSGMLRRRFKKPAGNKAPKS